MRDPRAPLHDNAGEQRFEMTFEEGVAFIQYRTTPDGTLALLHTEVPEALEGLGVGTALVEATLDLCREGGRSILPFCPFVHAYIRRHPSYLDLVAERYPHRADLAGR